MTGSPAQVPSTEEGVHLVLYDGVCGLCSRLLQFLLKHDHRAVFIFASLQSVTGRAMVERFGGNPRRTHLVLRLGQLSDGSRADIQQEQRRALRRRRARVALEVGSPDARPATRGPGPRLRRCRPKPVSRIWPPRTVPDAASGVPKPLRRVNKGGCMKVVIPGGSGQVGTVLARAFHGDGHDVIVLSRRPDVRPWRVVAWDGATLGNWRSEVDGCDVVISGMSRTTSARRMSREC